MLVSHQCWDGLLLTHHSVVTVSDPSDVKDTKHPGTAETLLTTLLGTRQKHPGTAETLLTMLLGTRQKHPGIAETLLMTLLGTLASG